jgi:hypothetical protein
MNPEFETYVLDSEGIEAAQIVAQIFNNALNLLLPLTGSSGREVSIVRTKLEEDCFFSKKAVSRNAGQRAKTYTGDPGR